MAAYLDRSGIQHSNVSIRVKYCAFDMSTSICQTEICYLHSAVFCFITFGLVFWQFKDYQKSLLFLNETQSYNRSSWEMNWHKMLEKKKIKYTCTCITFLDKKNALKHTM